MRYMLLSFLLVFSFCQHEIRESQLIVKVEKISLRSIPGVKGVEIGVLKKGQKLLDLGVVSHFESDIKFSDEALRTPWLKVQTADKQQGWVFAGALQPKLEQADWLFQKRLDCYFGHQFASRLNAWKESLKDLNSDQQCAAAYREALEMRDSMVDQLSRRAEPEGKPDYRWMSDVLTGFVYQQSGEPAPTMLFADYRFWGQLAKGSSGVADASFFETCFMAFPRDSIESFFPVWTFQFSELESASQLGTGIHLKILEQIDKALAASQLFAPELMQIKDALLEDMLDKNTRYWQSQEAILKDLDHIIAVAPTCLSSQESSAVRLRRVMLEDPVRHGIRVNLRSGE